jgi:predicted ester cyclase
MTRDEVTALFARRSNATNRHDVDALMADYADGCVLVSPMAGNVSGRNAIEQVYRAWFSAFPDVTHRLESLIVDGDHVAEIEAISGTDTGGFMGLAPTHKSFEVPLVRLVTFSGAQIVHERRIYDFTGLLVQIGVLKAKPA